MSDYTSSMGGVGGYSDRRYAEGASSTMGPADTPNGETYGNGASYSRLANIAQPSASDTYAALTQEQWENYVNVFQPIENQLIKYATDPNQVKSAMAAAHQNVLGAYSQQAGALSREYQGMGVTLTPEQKASQGRQMNLSEALADVQGQNVARDLTLQRQQSILGNPAPTTQSIAQQATALGA